MLSVLMATHNGSDTIARTLAAMAELEPPNGGWKLVVVNNASTDDTESQILKFQGRLPLDYVVEPRLGKPNAMNAALKRAEGDFVVMTDDDVLPDRNWLVEWRRVADSYPEITVFGGAITPEFEAPPPRWLPVGDYSMFFAATPDRAEGEIPPDDVFGAHCDVFGPNLAVRRAAIDDQAMFDRGFFAGPHGLMGEDTDFVRRLAARGYKVGFAPKARVRHIVQQQQTTWRWILRRCYRHGKYTRAMSGKNYTRSSSSSASRNRPFPKWLFQRLAKRSLALPIAILSFNSQRVFRQLKLVAYDLGSIKQALETAQSHRGREPPNGTE